MVSLGHGELTQQQIHLSACIYWMCIFYVCICVLHVCMLISFRLKITSMCMHTNINKIAMYTTNAMGCSVPAVLSGDLNTRSSCGRAIELQCCFFTWSWIFESVYEQAFSLLETGYFWRQASNPGRTRWRHLASSCFEFTPPCLHNKIKQQTTRMYIARAKGVPDQLVASNGLNARSS